MKNVYKIWFSFLFSLFSFLFSYAAISAPLALIENLTDEINTTGALTPNGKFYYATAIGTSVPTSLSAYSRNAETGKLTKIQTITTPELAPTVNLVNFSPSYMVIGPNSKYLYVAANFGSNADSALPYTNSILKFTIGADGKIMYANRITGTNADHLAISHSGTYMVATAQSGISLLSVGVNGNLNLISHTNKDKNDNTTRYPGAITFSSDDKNVYISSYLGGKYLYSYDFNSGDATLTNTQVFLGKSTSTAAIPDGVIDIDGQGGNSQLLTADGKFFYTVGGSRYGNAEGSITIFNRNPSNGILTLNKNVKTIEYPEGSTQNLLFSSDQNITISLNQKFLYVTDDIKEVVGMWSRNITTGDLEYIGLLPDVMGSSEGAEISSDGRHLYNYSTGGLDAFDLRADMSVVKTDAIDPVAPSGVIDYTLAVTNNGASDAQNVVVTDTLPEGTSFVSGTVNSPSGSCTAAGQKVTCTMGRIFVDGGFNAVIKVKAPSAAGTITNTASVSSDQVDSVTANNTDTETTSISIGEDSGTPDTDTPTDTDSPATSGGGGGSLPLGLLLLLFIALLAKRNLGYKLL